MKYKYKKSTRKSAKDDPYGTRTRVTAVKGRCLNRLTNGPELNLKRVTRIELATTAWKAVVLPLNYTRII